MTQTTEPDPSDGGDEKPVEVARNEPQLDDRAGQGKKSGADLIAILALVVSIAVGGFTAWRELEKGADDAHSQLTDILNRLSEVDAQAVQLSAADVPDEMKEFAGFGFANRKLVLLSRAEALLKDIEDRASAEDYAVLATGFYQIGDYPRAEKHLAVYLDRAKDPIKRSIGLRSSAMMALAAGDSSRAYELLDQALEAVGPPTTYAQRQAVLTIHLNRVQAMIAELDFPAAMAAVGDFVGHALTFPCVPDRGQALARAQQLAMMVAAAGKIAPPSTIQAIDLSAGNCPYDPAGHGVMPAAGSPDVMDLPSTSSIQPFSDLVGSYELNGQHFEIIEWVDGQLASVAIGQPTSRLFATEQPDRFTLEGFQQVVIDAIRSGDGDVLRLDIQRPDGTFSANRM